MREVNCGHKFYSLLHVVAFTYVNIDRIYYSIVMLDALNEWCDIHSYLFMKKIISNYFEWKKMQ